MKSEKVKSKNPERCCMRDFLEAPPGIGPGMRVLQTRALPLGHGAVSAAFGDWIIISRRKRFVNSFFQIHIGIPVGISALISGYAAPSKAVPQSPFTCYPDVRKPSNRKDEDKQKP